MSTITNDIGRGLSRWKTWLYLAYIEVKRRYALSYIGPNWTLISNALFVFLVSLLYAGILKEKLFSYAAYLSFGFIAWLLISECANEGSTVFIRGRKYLNSGGNSLTGICLNFIFVKLFIFAHSLPLLAVTWYLGGGSVIGLGLSALGLILIVLNILFYCLWVGAVTARFRDVAIAVQTFMRMMFFLSPILWSAKDAPGQVRQLFCIYNPFHYLLSIFRDTALYGEAVPWAWTVSIILTVINISIAAFVFTRTRKQIVYWVQ